MTHDDVMALRGRELDAVVAERVMGVDLATTPARYVLEYATDITDAWPVHRKAVEGCFSQRHAYTTALEDVIMARLGMDPRGGVIGIMGVLMHIGPEDICRAALLALDEPVPLAPDAEEV